MGRIFYVPDEVQVELNNVMQQYNLNKKGKALSKMAELSRNQREYDFTFNTDIRVLLKKMKAIK